MPITSRIILFLSLLVLPALAGAPMGDEAHVDEAIRLTDFGVEAARKGLWEEAYQRWNQALDAYPMFPAAHNNLAVVYEHRGEYEKAREHYIRAQEISREDRYISSNHRMFRQFYFKFIRSQLNETATKDVRERLAEAKQQNNSSEVEKEKEDLTQVRRDLFKQAVEEEQAETERMRQLVNDAINDSTYRKVGGHKQVFIRHPKRQTPLSGKYKRVYIAGFAPFQPNQINLNFETTEYLRSELRKSPAYEVIPLEELSLPKDLDEFDRLIDDYEFWSRLGNKVGADLIIYGLVNFYHEPSDGLFPFEYYDQRSGTYRTSTRIVPRTSFIIELDLFYHEASTGELVHQDSFAQTIIYRGRLEPTLQAFYDVMNRVLPRFMDVLVPREREAIRYLIFG